MRIILDHSVPTKLRSFLVGHTVETAYQRGWAALKNGALLKAIEAEGFEVFVTADQKMRYQQNLTGLPFAMVVLGTNLWPVIADHPGKIVEVMKTVSAGTVAIVHYPKPVLVRRPAP